MNNPVVSVVTPTYNRKERLKKAVQSVLVQTYKDLELIIVDDGSIDNTKQVVKKFQKNDDRVKYFYQENKGPAPARNLGIKKSTGKYIALLDSDDQWDSSKLEEQLKLFKNSSSKLGFVGCNEEVFRIKNGELVGKNNMFESRFGKQKESFTMNDFLQLKIPVNSTSALILKEAITDVGSYDTDFSVHEDYDLWIRLRDQYDFDTTWKVLAHRYYCDDGLSKTTNHLKKADSKCRLLKKHNKLYKKHSEARSVLLRKIGTDYVMAQKRGKGLNYLLRSIKENPLKLRNYANLFIALFGKWAYEQVLKYKRL